MIHENLGLSIYEVKFKKVTYKQRYKRKVVVKQRFWKKRKDNVKQRYWKKVEKIQKYWKKVTKEKALIRYKTRRFDFWGSKKDIEKVVKKCFEEGWIPKRRFIRGSAKQFLKTPERYGFRIGG